MLWMKVRSPHAPREVPTTYIACTGNNHHGHALRESFPHAEREDYVIIRLEPKFRRD